MYLFSRSRGYVEGAIYSTHHNISLWLMWMLAFELFKPYSRSYTNCPLSKNKATGDSSYVAVLEKSEHTFISSIFHMCQWNMFSRTRDSDNDTFLWFFLQYYLYGYLYFTYSIRIRTLFETFIENVWSPTDRFLFWKFDHCYSQLWGF